MHNEPLASVESEPVVKSSKLDRMKSTVTVVTWIAIPVAMTGALTYLSWKMTSTQLQTAKLNLETAKLNSLKP